MKENNVKNIIDLINTNLDKLDINRVDKSITDPFLPDTIGRKREDSFISSHSLSTINSKTTNKTLESVPFNEEKDLDLPNFTSTKYKPLIWRIFHSLTYFLYTVFFMGSTICFYFNSNKYNIILTISNGFFLYLFLCSGSIIKEDVLEMLIIILKLKIILISLLKLNC